LGGKEGLGLDNQHDGLSVQRGHLRTNPNFNSWAVSAGMPGHQGLQCLEKY